jgi:hypothetical protein
MAIRNPVEMLPTMKIDADKKNELDLAFSECQATILEIRDVETKKFGTKTIMTLDSDEKGKFNIFLNNYSIEKLCEAFGNDDVNWKGKLVNLKKEKDKQFNNDMIVTFPVA